ncbi:MAG: Fe-S cluster domain-containing protein [Rikenellaceae bacterium]|nr:Fe-S cluster domain-containing protein [Rikenellaceae bacterium]
MNVILFTILTLVALGVLAAVILYFVAQKFKVYEDPRIDQVEALLPGANCGGCGYPGCRGLAETLVKEEDISALYCPVGGGECMKLIAAQLGKAAPEKEPQIAVVRCNGSCANRPRINRFDGTASCAVIAATYGGETACTFGCLGKGDCTVVCNFDAIHLDPETDLPVVDEEKCTACGACVKACPKILIELRKKGPKGRRVYVCCMNKDKGGVARKACKAACIGCGKCVKTCPFEAIALENNLAYIDYNKCRLCRKCVPECPTGAIHETNFPPAKPKPEKPKTEKTTAQTDPKASAAVKPVAEKPAARAAMPKEAAAVEPQIEAQTKPITTPLVERPKVVASQRDTIQEPVVLDKEQLVPESMAEPTGEKTVDQVKTETVKEQQSE